MQKGKSGWAKVINACLLSTISFSQLAVAYDSDVLDEVRRLYDAPDYKKCMQVLEPKMSGSLRDNGNAHIYYGLLLLQFHRYKEAKDHLTYGLRLDPYSQIDYLARPAITTIPGLEAAYNADRAQGFGSLGLHVQNNHVTSTLIPN